MHALKIHHKANPRQRRIAFSPTGKNDRTAGQLIIYKWAPFVAGSTGCKVIEFTKVRRALERALVDTIFPQNFKDGASILLWWVNRITRIGFNYRKSVIVVGHISERGDANIAEISGAF